MDKPKEKSYVIACRRRDLGDQLIWSVVAFYANGEFQVHIGEYSYIELDGVTHWYYLNKKQRVDK